MTRHPSRWWLIKSYDAGRAMRKWKAFVDGEARQRMTAVRGRDWIQYEDQPRKSRAWGKNDVRASKKRVQKRRARKGYK